MYVELVKIDYTQLQISDSTTGDVHISIPLHLDELILYFPLLCCILYCLAIHFNAPYFAMNPLDSNLLYVGQSSYHIIQYNRTTECVQLFVGSSIGVSGCKLAYSFILRITPMSHQIFKPHEHV